MLRRLVLVLLPLALLAAVACSSDSNSDSNDPASGAAATAPAASLPTDTPSDTGAGDTDTGVAAPTTVIDDTDSDAIGNVPVDSGGDALLGAINPLELLSVASSGDASTAQPDPALTAALLTLGDLPDDFLAMGAFGYALPTEFGDLHMAANMFVSGDIMSGDLGAMLMSAAIAVPPDQIDQLGDPGDWGSATDADLQELRDVMQGTGITLSELNLLDASGLGEGGLGMHMTMDFGDLFGALGAPDDGNPFADGISMDMYVFLRGDRLLMTMVMWPAGGSSGVDGHALAEVMDGRAS